jgi:hypothetical protein
MSLEDSKMNEIEAALAAWTPCPIRIDRDQLMFEAGRASARSDIAVSPTEALPVEGRVRVRESAARYFWPATSCISTAAALVMAFMLAYGRAERDSVVQHRAADVGAPQAAIARHTPAPADSVRLRRGPSHVTALPDVADGTYLALRNRMLTTPAHNWPVRTFETSIAPRAAIDDARPAPTSRNLLQEFLPREIEPEPSDSDETPAAFSAEHNEVIS